MRCHQLVCFFLFEHTNNLFVNASGIGILSIPYALSSGGWLSLITLILIAAAACFTGLLLRKCMDTDPDITTYSDIAGHAFGRKG